MFLDEYAKRLKDGRYINASLTTIHHTLARAGLNIKRVQKLAAERSPTIRADFIRCIAQYPTEYLMCLDEVLKDDRTYARLWGRSHMGTRVEQHAPFVCKRCFSMVAALALDEGIVAVKVIEGSFDRERFMEYLCDDVVNFLFFFLVTIPSQSLQLPMSTPYPGPRSILIMDNA
jgi:hypothetical protein